MDEFDFINKLQPKRIFQSNVVVGIGDDAAVYKPSKDKNQVVCVDTMVEGVHFLKDTSNPEEIGYKALAVNISDIAAMGAIPRYYLVSIAIPSNWAEEDLLKLYHGMGELAAQYEMDLIGGDTVSIADKLVVTVTVIGEADARVETLRSKAKEHDVVFVTGNIGDSSAGLAILLSQLDVDNQAHQEYLINRHKRPTPRVKASEIIAALERAALNDISDGLASELHEIVEASQLGITINEADIPISEALCELKKSNDITKWILYGGEDFELVGTTSVESWNKLKRVCEEQSIKITKIGSVTSSHSSVQLVKKNLDIVFLEKSGYNHFKNKLGE